MIRHVVTKYIPPVPNSGEANGSSPLGEFANEEQAEAVRAAFEFLHAPRAYLMVKRTFELETLAQHADTQEEADAFVAAKLAEGEEWRVFERILTDPVAKAMHSVRPVESSDCFIGPKGRKMVEASRYFGPIPIKD